MGSVVRIYPGPPILGRVFVGGLAQLGERLVCNQEVTGSSPVFSTSSIARGWRGQPGRLEVLDTRFVFVEFRGVMLRIDI